MTQPRAERLAGAAFEQPMRRPGRGQRQRDRVLAARGALPEEGRRRLERIEAMFTGPPPEVGQDKAA